MIPFTTIPTLFTLHMYHIKTLLVMVSQGSTITVKERTGMERISLNNEAF